MTFTTKKNAKAIPLRPLDADSLKSWKSSAGSKLARWVEATDFEAGAGELCALPDADGNVAAYLFGRSDVGYLYQLAAVANKLPAGVYRLECDWNAAQRAQASLGWGLATYCFNRYKKGDGNARRELVLDADLAKQVKSLLEAQVLVRDLVNTPTEDMGPEELEDAVRQVAQRFDADCRVIRGDDLLKKNFPAIHAVGRASARPPRLIELSWGKKGDPLIALVGKGVCFDTGGLNLKSTTNMALMKKDMGGAAHALALTQLVMQQRLPLRVHLLIPAVENSVSGNAYRPGDIIATRKGLSVEIGNTDAEGRVILADALSRASELKPELIIDFATLTGAARIAMGTDLPPLFSNDGEFARAIQQAGDETEDPLWTLPLWQPYNTLIESKVADLNNAGSSTYGGCITAALFLEHFVSSEDHWVHIDTFAWNLSSRPGRPEGGEALGLRAVFRYLQGRCAARP